MDELGERVEGNWYFLVKDPNKYKSLAPIIIKMKSKTWVGKYRDRGWTVIPVIVHKDIRRE